MQILRHKKPPHRQKLFFLRRTAGLKQRINPAQSQQSHKKPDRTKTTLRKTNRLNKKLLNKKTTQHTKTKLINPYTKKARRCVLFLCIECLDFRLSCSWFHFAIFRLHTVVFWIAFRRVFGGLTAYFQHNTIFLQTSL